MILTGDGIGHHGITIITMIIHQIMIIIGMIGKVIIGLLMIVMDGGVIGMKKKKVIKVIKIGGMMMDGEMKGFKMIKMIIITMFLLLLLLPVQHQAQLLVQDLSQPIQIVLLK